MIVRTDAVVLRAFDYGETSRIATLLTRRHGVVGVLAKGARRPTSRFGAALQPGAHVEVIYYFREGRGLQTLKEATHVARYPGVSGDLDRLTLALRLLELVRALLPEGEAQPVVLALLIHALGWLDGAGGGREAAFAANALPWFQLRLASLLGFAPDLRREEVLALADGGGVLLLDTGAVAPPGLAGRATRAASRGALRAFAVLARTDLPTAGRMRLDPETRIEVEGLVDAYLRYHSEGTIPEHVRRVAGQMEGNLAAAHADRPAETGAEPVRPPGV
jgi:DNA repair protein RecO (recombination protein O)